MGNENSTLNNNTKQQQQFKTQQQKPQQKSQQKPQQKPYQQSQQQNHQQQNTPYQQKYIDENIEDIVDPLKIFNLDKNYDINSLKREYKKLVLKYHPDKNRDIHAPRKFEIITKCYIVLLEKLNNKETEDRIFSDLKKGSSEYIQNQEAVPKRNREYQEKQSFNVDRFNRVFDENKLKDEEDEGGYSDWMEKSNPDRPTLDVPKNKNIKSENFNINIFNTTFDKIEDNSSREVIKFIEPQPLNIQTRMNYTELGSSNTDDYSNKSEHAQLHYTDYKKAHSTTKLIDPKKIQSRPNYKTIDDLEADRSKVQFMMSEEDEYKYNELKRKEQAIEEKRLEKLRERDELYTRHYNKVNGLFLDNRQ